jgi:hypothetical protein
MRARMTGAKKPGPREEHEGNRKAIAQGMPDDRLNLWFSPPAFFLLAGHG